MPQDPLFITVGRRDDRGEGAGRNQLTRKWMVNGLGRSGGGLQGDPVAKGFEFADVVALLTVWVDAGVVVIDAEVVELGALVAKQVPDDDQDGTAYRDDGFLLASASGDAAVAFAQERVGPARADGGLAQDPGQTSHGLRC